MINITLGCFASSIIIISYGILFDKSILKKKIQEIDYYEVGIFGFILIGFLALSINFIFPLNKIIGSIFFFISIIYFLFHLIESQKKKELILIICIMSFITFSMLTLSNINRPDAGLYHLPYISVLNENKIVTGITNLHYRFGHISIIQYISAIHNNHLMKVEFLNAPLASIFAVYTLFLVKKFRVSIHNKSHELIVIKFLIIVFSLYSFNRFSNYGNDIPSHIFFFILVIFLLEKFNLDKIDNTTFYKISFISVFLFTLKPFMIIVLIIPLILLILNKNKFIILKDLRMIICSVFILIWFIKNILTSGCLIFPIKETCFSNLNYFDKKIVNIASNEATAWSKGFPDQKKNKKLSLSEYNTNFNWFSTWKENHFNKIKKKILPFLFFVTLFVFPYMLKNSHNFNYQSKPKHNKSLILLTIFSFICSLYWFFYFPVYRFGLSFLATFLILIFSLIFFKFRNIRNIKYNYFWTIILILFIGVMGKNYSRIFSSYDKLYNNYPWPKIYTLKENEKNIEKEFKKITDKKQKFLYYYSGGEECMYSKSPCTHMLNDKLNKKVFLGYKIFYLQQN